MRKIFAVLTYSSFLCFLVLNINAAEIEPIEGYSENPKAKEAALCYSQF